MHRLAVLTTICAIAAVFFVGMWMSGVGSDGPHPGLVPVLGPLAEVGRVSPLTDDDVLRAWAKAHPNRSWHAAAVTKTRIADYADPPRHAPLLGNVELHHIHYQCTITGRQTIRFRWPCEFEYPGDNVSRVILVDYNFFAPASQQ